jgi:hypothetical protein
MSAYLSIATILVKYSLATSKLTRGTCSVRLNVHHHVRLFAALHVRHIRLARMVKLAHASKLSIRPPGPPHVRLRDPPLAGDALMNQRLAIGGERGDLGFDAGDEASRFG